jgi:pimeloyl-ACP methyl ester carboxylesterase
MWEYLDIPSNSVQAYYIDLPGHGLSKLPIEKVPSIESMANAVIALVHHYNLNQFDIVGHSMGGYVALHISRLLPHHGKVILLNSNFWDDTPEKKNNRNRVISIVSQNKNLFIQEAIHNLFYDSMSFQHSVLQLIEEAKKMNQEAIIFASEAMRDRVDLSEFAYSNAGQLCCIQGENDTIVHEEEMKKRCNGKIPYVIIPGVGHMSHIENPPVVSATLKDILLDQI